MDFFFFFVGGGSPEHMDLTPPGYGTALNVVAIFLGPINMDNKIRIIGLLSQNLDSNISNKILLLHYC